MEHIATPQEKSPSAEKEYRANLEKYQRQLQDALEKNGCLTYGPDHETILDVERLMDANKKTDFFHSYAFKKKLRPQFTTFTAGAVEALYYGLKGENIIRKDDWENSQLVAPESKPLFYEPETEQAAFNIRQIVKQKFHFLPHELKTTVWEKAYPSTQEHLPMDEVTIAALIYHPDFGAGYRDENGTLMVLDPETGDFQKINGEWFTKKWGVLADGTNLTTRSMNTPHEFLKHHGAHLIQYGLLTPDDFRTAATGRNRERQLERSHISSKGTLSIRGTIHHLGREFTKEPVRIYDIAPGLGGIAHLDEQGNAKLTHAFQVFEQNHPELPQVKYGDSGTRGYARAEHTNVLPVTRERLPQETHAEQIARLKTLDNFEKVLKFSNTLWEETGIGTHKLPTIEQYALQQAYTGLSPKNQEKIPDFVKRNGGVEALRSLLSITDSEHAPSDLFALTEAIGPAASQKLFKSYAKILDTAEDVYTRFTTLTKQQPTEEQHARVRSMLIERANKLILSLAMETKTLCKKLLIQLTV